MKSVEQIERAIMRLSRADQGAVFEWLNASVKRLDARAKKAVTKKKATGPRELGPIPGFDAVAASRRWRVNTGRRLAKMTPEERIAYLNRSRDDLLAPKKKHPPT
jgi:hypothetical protein